MANKVAVWIGATILIIRGDLKKSALMANSFGIIVASYAVAFLRNGQAKFLLPLVRDPHHAPPMLESPITRISTHPFMEYGRLALTTL